MRTPAGVRPHIQFRTSQLQDVYSRQRHLTQDPRAGNLLPVAELRVKVRSCLRSHTRNRTMSTNPNQIPADLDAAQTTTSSNVVPIRPDIDKGQKPENATRNHKAPRPKARKYAWADKVREDVSLSSNAKVVAWYLSGLFDADEEAAFPTHARIEKRTGLKPKTVQRAIRELEDAEYLRRELGKSILGGNKYRPTWAKLSETPAEVDTSDPRGGQDGPLGVDTSDPRRGTIQTPIIQGEYQGNSKSKEKLLSEQNKGCADASPPVPPCGFQDLGRKPSGWDNMDWDDEYAILVSRFPGNAMETDYRGWFCRIRKDGFTLDDMLVALDYDALIGNPEGVSRCMPSFFAAYFGEGTERSDVEWRKPR